MPDDVSDIEAFYDADPDREHSRLDHQQLEHELTWRYLDKHLPADGTVLEVGAATGRYSLELARRGYSVTAVDLSGELVKRARRRIVDAGMEAQVQCVVADARDLSGVPGSAFDAVLLMGPLYHLVEAADRRAALEQAHDRLRPGGVFISSLLSRYGVLSDLIKRSPEWIENQDEVRSVLTSGSRPDGAPRGGFRGYLARVAEIVPLHEDAGFETVAVDGLEPVIAADDESFNRLEGKRRQLWLDLLQEVGSEPSILGASRHMLYIGRKPK